MHRGRRRRGKGDGEMCEGRRMARGIMGCKNSLHRADCPYQEPRWGAKSALRARNASETTDTPVNLCIGSGNACSSCELGPRTGS